MLVWPHLSACLSVLEIWALSYRGGKRQIGGSETINTYRMEFLAPMGAPSERPVSVLLIYSPSILERSMQYLK